MAGTPLALASLLKGALSASKTIASPPDPVLDAFRLERVQAYIETHLTDPELTVERVAGATAFSRTALYRVFEPVGGIANYIQRRRLARMRASLFRHTERRTIAALAYEHGFVSESHCSRVFRKAFGLPPGQFRQELVQARGTLPSDDSAPKVRLASWMHELF
jgi:AraC-like DNA-binding protein